jgi:hypothetical protein
LFIKKVQNFTGTLLLYWVGLYGESTTGKSEHLIYPEYSGITNKKQKKAAYKRK